MWQIGETIHSWTVTGLDTIGLLSVVRVLHRILVQLAYRKIRSRERLRIGVRQRHQAKARTILGRIPGATISITGSGCADRGRCRTRSVLSSLRPSTGFWQESTGSQTRRDGKSWSWSWCHERRRINCRHPNTGFVNLEEIGHQRVEVDV